MASSVACSPACRVFQCYMGSFSNDNGGQWQSIPMAITVVNATMVMVTVLPVMIVMVAVVSLIVIIQIVYWLTFVVLLA